MIEAITYSSDDGRMSREDIDETSRISEAYFGTEKDSSQIPTTPATRDWIYKNGKDCLNIIRADGIIIGYSLLLPCTTKLMEDFLERKITEAALFEAIKGTRLAKPIALYLCASVVEERFRWRGLATLGFTKLIQKILAPTEHKPVLFYLKYSEEGQKLAERVARATGLELRART